MANHSEEYFRKQVEESEKSKILYQETIKALQTEERFVNFFEGYNAASVEAFIKYYAMMKAWWFKEADSNYEYRSGKNNTLRNECVDLLRLIYIKKLFDVKCRWVAGEIDIEGIEISNDFEKLRHFPEQCTFLEPITDEEFNCLLHYLEFKKSAIYLEQKEAAEDDYYFEEDSAFSTFGHYHWHKALYVEGYEEMIPPWFHFYDKRFHTGELLNLPLIRKEMEIDLYDFHDKEIRITTLNEAQRKNYIPYPRLLRKEHHENPEKKAAFEELREQRYKDSQKNIPKYEHYNVYGEFLDKVAEAIESPETRNYQRAYTLWHKRRKGNELIESEIINLGAVNEWVAIESADDYRDAVKKAYSDYKEKKVAEALPFIFEEYRKCIAKNKPFNWNSNKDRYYNDETKKILLEALQFKGEPMNFDFLKKDNLPKS